MAKVKFHKQKDNHYHIGSVYLRDGDLIYVRSGNYIGDYNRISNHFYWHKVKADGSLSKRECSGYGETELHPVKCKITIHVSLAK